MRFDNLSDWLNWLYELHAEVMDLGLARITAVAKRMQLTKPSAYVITVAGTNGKGSCIALLEQILLAQGYRVGVYTSPHLQDYCERIRVNGEKIPQLDLCHAFAAIDSDRQAVSLRFFEFFTLAALWYFQQQSLDIILLEVGLGGRLDAVNVVGADMALITTIDFDHQEWLGDSRHEIAYNKAGIFREQQIAICGDYDPPMIIAEQAKKFNALLFLQNKDFAFYDEGHKWRWWNAYLHLQNLPVPKINLQNASTALQALTLLPERLPVTEQAIRTGLEKVFLPGRFQFIQNRTNFILDVAHNSASAQLLANNLTKFKKFAKTYAIVAMLHDKDISATLTPMLSQVDMWWVAGLETKRGGGPEKVGQILQKLTDKPIHLYANVEMAYHHALQTATQEDVVVVFGSFHTVGEVLTRMQLENDL